MSFSARLASHLSSKNFERSAKLFARRVEFGSRYLRNIRQALAEISLNNFGVRLIIEDPCQIKYLELNNNVLDIKILSQKKRLTYYI